VVGVGQVLAAKASLAVVESEHQLINEGRSRSPVCAPDHEAQLAG
jgi:hypothetical protein